MTLAEAKTLGRGGRRVGAGRPRAKTLRRNVGHESRPPHAAWVPVHVTLRRAGEVPDLRLPTMLDEVVNCIRLSQREDFRIAHYSVQSDHAHLIVEADHEGALTSGIRGFTIRVARRLNSRVLRRRGQVWADRFHRHDLRTPTEVRNALVYVLANGTKHGYVERGALDPCSSARWFEGWVTPLPPPPSPSPVAPPRTWLLREGWLKVHPGYLFPSEVPKAAR